jgi:hypothetical protein
VNLAGSVGVLGGGERLDGRVGGVPVGDHLLEVGSTPRSRTVAVWRLSSAADTVVLGRLHIIELLAARP